MSKSCDIWTRLDSCEAQSCPTVSPHNVSVKLSGGSVSVRLVVIGRYGQIARSIIERAPLGGTVALAMGRPELDLANATELSALLAQAAPDVIVNAAAYTAVDLAESEPELADAVNNRGAGLVARAAAALGVPMVHISTDYVFDGTCTGPYTEADPVAPLGAYGRSKVAGEIAVAQATTDYVTIRTAWVYSPFGRNFVTTMLRLAATRKEVCVVADQRGSPTSALDIADGIIAVARNLLHHPEASQLRGLFHMTPAGWTTWAEFACEILRQSEK